MKWTLLILSLPTQNATVRQRAWRALKASGAAVLRDGVYLMPDRYDCRQMLENVAHEVRHGGGSAHVLQTHGSSGYDYAALFDRSADYNALLHDIGHLRETLSAASAQDTVRRTRKLRRSWTTLGDIDFFPGPARTEADAALQDLEQACARALSADEPVTIEGAVEHLNLGDYQARVWATRRRPWVDRLASAWLIRRYIDPQAHIMWLEQPADCPPEALGFDFDGARFTHIGQRVSFEVLLASFALQRPPLRRLAQLVHCLDVGGVQTPEAPAVEAILAGLRNSLADDDQLLAAASSVFDGLLASFSPEADSA